jgi:hypothetical protein
MAMLSRMIDSDALTGVTTQGVNGVAAVPSEAVAATGHVQPTQVKVYVSAKAYVAWGGSATADATPPAAKAIQQAATEEVYTFDAADPVYTHLWVYSLSGTLDADVSWFG